MKRWPTKPLGEVCAINPKLSATETPTADTKVTFVPMAAVDEINGSIAFPELRPYNQVSKGYTPFKENDVLFAKITPCMQNGKAAIAQNLSGGLGFGSTEFHVLRPIPSLLSKWVFAFIRQPSFRSAAEAHFTGSAGQKRVPADFLKKFPIPVPPLTEQERIVKLLDEANELQKLRAQANRRAGSLIPALFDDMFGDPESNIKGWPIVSLDEISDGIVDGPFGSNLKTSDYVETGVPVLQGKNITGNVFQWFDVRFISDKKANELKRSEVRIGDHLLIKIGSIGYSAIVEHLNGNEFAIIPANMVRIRPNTSMIDSSFLHAFLTTPQTTETLKSRASQTAQPALSLRTIKTIKIPVPPLALQKEFAQRVTEIRELEAAQATSRTYLDALFQSMLHRAFNGQL
jgi:type I restriction enzyme, S subunit